MCHLLNDFTLFLQVFLKVLRNINGLNISLEIHSANNHNCHLSNPFIYQSFLVSFLTYVYFTPMETLWGRNYYLKLYQWEYHGSRRLNNMLRITKQVRSRGGVRQNCPCLLGYIKWDSSVNLPVWSYSFLGGPEKCYVKKTKHIWWSSHCKPNESS